MAASSEQTSLLASASTRPCSCSCCSTPTLRALWLAAISFLLLSTAQLVAAYVSNSLELQIDAWTMLIDTSSYAFNIAAEKQRTIKRTAKSMLRMVAIVWSIASLLGVTMYLMVYSAQRLVNERKYSRVDIDQNYMLGFSIIGLFIDLAVIVSIVARYRGGWARMLGLGNPPTEGGEGTAAEEGAAAAAPMPKAGALESKSAAEEDAPGPMVHAHGGGSDLNVTSAIAHVLMDGLRSVTSLVSALIMYANPSFDGENIDAAGALFDSAVTLVIVSFLVHELVRELRSSHLSRLPE